MSKVRGWKLEFSSKYQVNGKDMPQPDQRLCVSGNPLSKIR